MSAYINYVPLLFGWGLLILLAFMTMVIVLRQRQGLLSLILFATFGVLLIICWKTDATAGILPIAFTIVYVVSACDVIVKLARSRGRKR